MKKTIYLFTTIILIFSCASDFDDNTSEVSTAFNFTHNWDGIPVSNNSFNVNQFVTENGDALSITKLRYLISNITFTKPTGEDIFLEGFNLVDVTNNSNLTFIPLNTIPTGDYSNVKFTFGFNNNDNYNNNYNDLNSVSWNVPEMLGGGYHFMQLEGKFINNSSVETGYAYHAIRAVNNTSTPKIFQDTFFEVNLGAVAITNNATFNMEMNIAQWFKSPKTWDLNLLNNMLMPNFEAQVYMFENGKNVFSLKSVSQ